MQAGRRTIDVRAIAALFATALFAVRLIAAPPPADEPLEPDLAFRPDARLVAGSTPGDAGSQRHGIDIEYRIAPGYYLYRSRLRFEISPPDLLIGAPELPPGVEIDDPFVGKSAVYRERVRIHLPFLVSVAKPGSYRVNIVAQGCAEERLCYAPFPQTLAVTIAPGYRATDSPQPPATRGLPR